MATIKKLTFAPLFLIVFALLFYQLNPTFKSLDFIFSLSLSNLIQLLMISGLVYLSALFFILFAALALDWKIVLPIGLITGIFPIIFLNQTIGVVLVIGIYAVFLISFLSLENIMKTYLNFQPVSLFGPSIRHLTTLLILIISIGYFLSINKVITQNGFQIPDSLIDTVLKFTQSDTNTAQKPSVSKEQLDLLKKNPSLLQQSGVDPKILDSLGSSAQKAIQSPINSAGNLIKQSIKDQLQNLIKPFLGYIPFILALLLFLTLQSLTSIFSLLNYFLLWMIFFIMEKTKFIKFTTEMRPVKKMLV